MRRVLVRTLLALIAAYRFTLGRLLGGSCRFYPSCSEYASAAIEANGALVGSGQAIWRILRCGPWSAGGVEYPKPRRARTASIDTAGAPRG